MRVVFFGSGEFAVPTLRWLTNSKHELVAVVTQPDRRGGRGKKYLPTPVADIAEESGYSVLKCEDVNTKEFVDQVGSFSADLGIVAAFGQKLLAPLRKSFVGECVNIHASLLPKYRGAGPITWAILNGEIKTGVTVFRLVDSIDAGPILIRRETMIRPNETSGDLHDRLSRIGCDAIGATLARLEKDLNHPGEEQDVSEVTLAPKLKKSDGFIDFNENANKIALRCRAMWPWPGARCLYRKDELKSEEIIMAIATPVPAATIDKPGTITAEFTVATTEGVLEIHSLKPAGKRLMGWKDFINGRQVVPGDRFEALSK